MSANPVRNRTLLLILSILSAAPVLSGQTAVTGLFSDPRDGKTYRTVNIGGQWWLAQNLNFATGTRSCFLEE